MHTIYGRNVNEVFPTGLSLLRRLSEENVRVPKGKQTTIEYPDVVCSEYTCPIERVLFDEVRDINPFFHLMEALWILSGRKDVKWLSFFNKNMANYSDNGVSFHAAYGHRLRKNNNIDQLKKIIEILKKDPQSRQAVTSIWDVKLDLGTKTKDMPCNDMQFFKIRKDVDGHDALDITVCCRSNDMIWGCYGTNVVQFSVIQEYVANGLGIPMGTYRQISDSFHLYPDTDVYQRLCLDRDPNDCLCDDKYSEDYVETRALPTKLINTNIKSWDKDLREFMKITDLCIKSNINPRNMILHTSTFSDKFFIETAWPIFAAWSIYKQFGKQAAINYLECSTEKYHTQRNDWFVCAAAWFNRRKERIHGPIEIADRKSITSTRNYRKQQSLQD